jgi:hypothetical protein
MFGRWAAADILFCNGNEQGRGGQKTGGGDLEAKLKNFFVKIFYLAVVLSVAGFTGCRGPLEPLREAPAPQGNGRVVISIGGDTGGAQARTVAPDTGAFTKYTLTFSGPAARDPVDVTGDGVAVELPSGSWTISAVGYTGTAGSYTEAAEGSVTVNVKDGDTSQVIVVLGPKPTAAGKGNFAYSITVPAGVTGSLFITTVEGGAVSGGTITVTAGTANAGASTLDPGQYLVRVRLEKGGLYAGFTEALHIYAGLTSTLPARVYTDSDFTEVSPSEQVIESLTGVWYSHYSGIGRLDGYRVGKWKDFEELMVDSGKIALFPEFEPVPYAAGKTPLDDDYFVFYDDTVYGEREDGTGGNGGWGEGMSFRYMGIVRAVNVFTGDLGRGAIIIEYLKGCAPQWDEDIKDGQRPFFGVYYRKVDADTVQLANAVDLDALSGGEKYYTETATLQEAIDKNTAENDSAFIVWGVVIPQDREP